MSELKRSLPCLAISDGLAGNARQAEALAAALAAANAQGLSLRPRAPWRWCAPHRLPGDHAAFGTDFARVLQTPPALAVGCGRQAALATRLLRARGSRVVQILDPRLRPRHWDLLVVPEHDGLRGDNVLTLRGSLNPIDDAWLAQGRADFATLAALPAPRIVLLVGGATAQVDWQPQQLGRLCQRLAALAGDVGGSLLVSASRRTSTLALLALRHGLRSVPSLLWGSQDDGPNPYRGLLGWADAIVVTADSVNLLSEACASRVPVTAAFAEAARGRVQRFVRSLEYSARLQPLDTLLRPASAIVPLRETARIAAEVKQRLA